PRVRIIHHATNRGIAHSRQEALELARGRYIAWADADDISLPDRLQRQVAFLDSHPDVVILGSPAQIIDEGGKPTGWLFVPSDSLGIRWMSLLASPFVTSSVTLRADAVHTHGLTFDPEHPVAEDYNFWTKLLRYGDGVNFSEALVQY